MTDQKILNIYQRINKVMADVTTIKKEDKKVNNQYTFVSHDEVARVMHGALQKNGIVIVPSVKSFNQDGNRTEVMMDISFINIDDPSDQFTTSYPGYGIDSQDKGIGKAISYAVKYALLKTFCLETSDDVEKDNIDYKPRQEKPPILEKITKEQAAQLKGLIEHNYEHYMGRIKIAYNVNFIEELTHSQFIKIIDKIRIEGIPSVETKKKVA